MKRERKTETEASGSQTISHLRCAIYTRKSSDEGLNQEFNSLDAQRESAEAFIFSQRGDGLVALPEHYDDGGFSGGNLDRPALERLLADIRGGAVDCVVVYKVDRLSRSLIDFARIIEVFEKHNVSFVSVTQQFNTTNSLGRLTLNILLSFAQFEREIIAERTRDKISAARRKGKWTGGRPMLGYDIDPRGSRLIVNADEALQVRAIFELYLDYNALLPVVHEIDRRGWRTKQWVTRSGMAHGGTRFTKGRLFRLLRNPIYIGKVFFKKQLYEGEHKAIVETAIWENVQQILQRNGRNGGAEVRDTYGALLKKLLRCAVCHAPMMRTYSTKESRRYHHYFCTESQKGESNCQGRPVSEPVIKAVVTRQIRGIGSDRRIVARTMVKAEDRRQSSVADLTLERQAAQAALASLGTELGKATKGSGGDQPVANEMVEIQERIDKTERRLTEILQELESLAGRAVDENDLRTMLGQFEAVWESLRSREQTRIINSLIHSVLYNGRTNKVTVSFRSAGIRESCKAGKPNTSPC